MEKNFFSIVNRNHQRRSIMDQIDKNLRYDLWAKRLNKISARRKKLHTQIKMPLPVGSEPETARRSVPTLQVYQILEELSND